MRSKPGSLSLCEARAGREPERGVPKGLLFPTLSSLWEEREKKLAAHSRNPRFSPRIRLSLKAIWNKRMKTFLATTLFVAGFASFAPDNSAQEWTRFRGPNGTGISHAKTIPTKIGEADINWKVELPATGHSAPVLWGNRIFLTSTGDKAGGLYVLCLSAMDGKLLWRRDFPLTPFPRHPFNSYAASTPAVDAERVYVVWNEPEHYLLTALDHDGKTVWQRDFGSFVSQHGCGISPIVYMDKIILGNDQDDQKFVKESTRSGESFIVAVNARTGKSASLAK